MFVYLIQVKDVMKDIMADLQQTNTEKILLSWVRQSSRNYPQVNVINFTSSWSDGLAFNALIHSHRYEKYSMFLTNLSHTFVLILFLLIVLDSRGLVKLLYIFIHLDDVLNLQNKYVLFSVNCYNCININTTEYCTNRKVMVEFTIFIPIL